MQARLEGWSRGVCRLQRIRDFSGTATCVERASQLEGGLFYCQVEERQHQPENALLYALSRHCDGAFHLRASAELALFPMRQRPVSQEWTGPRHPWTSSDSGSVPTGSVPPPDPRLSKSSLRIQRGPSSSAMCKHVQHGQHGQAAVPYSEPALQFSVSGSRRVPGEHRRTSSSPHGAPEGPGAASQEAKIQLPCSRNSPVLPKAPRQ